MTRIVTTTYRYKRRGAAKNDRATSPKSATAQLGKLQNSLISVD